MQTQNSTQNKLDAALGDPVIGVHVLSQFLFCPRAGIIAHESCNEQPDEEPPVQLDVLPRYELSEIEQAFTNRFSTLIWQFAALLVTVAVGLFLAMKFAPSMVGGLVPLVVLFIVVMAPTAQSMWELSKRHRAFTAALAAEPDPHCDELQPVNWCSLLKAGFMSTRYHRLMQPKWKVEGRPWRVLRRGALRIPVFLQPGTGGIHPKHIGKVGAYCSLLESCETFESPYGIILKQDTLEGVAVPFNARARRMFQEGLHVARKAIRDAASDKEAAPPEQVSLCSGCPFGKPYRYKPTSTDDVSSRVSLPMFALIDREQTIYHSLCGDRFCWVAPHSEAKEKMLEELR